MLLHEIGHVVFGVNNTYKKDEYNEYSNLTTHTNNIIKIIRLITKMD